MDISEYTTEELLALASGLGLADPVVFQRPPISTWPSEVRDEVVQIGIRSLGARGLAQARDGRELVVPELIAQLARVVCTADLLVQIVRVEASAVSAVWFLATPTLSAGQRLTPLGNHRFTLIPTEHLGAALIEAMAIPDRAAVDQPSTEVAATEIAALFDAATKAEPDDTFDALARRAGVSGATAAFLQSLSVDGASGTAVQVLGPAPSLVGLEGSLTAWVDAGERGLWSVDMAGVTGDQEPAVQITRASRDALLASVAEGLPTWLPTLPADV